MKEKHVPYIIEFNGNITHNNQYQQIGKLTNLISAEILRILIDNRWVKINREIDGQMILIRHSIPNIKSVILKPQFMAMMISNEIEHFCLEYFDECFKLSAVFGEKLITIILRKNHINFQYDVPKNLDTMVNLTGLPPIVADSIEQFEDSRRLIHRIDFMSRDFADVSLYKSDLMKLDYLD